MFESAEKDNLYERSIKRHTDNAMYLLSHIWDLKINNTEFLKLRAIIKEVIARTDSDKTRRSEDDEIDSNLSRTENIKASIRIRHIETEAISLFLQREYGLGYEIIDSENPPDDVRKYLKVLQKRKASGDME